MLFRSAKKNHEKAVSNYNTAVADVQTKCDTLNNTRNECISAMEYINTLINSIKRTPRKIKQQVSKLEIEQVKYRETKSFSKESIINSVIAGAAAGVSLGAVYAVMKVQSWILKLILLIPALIGLLFSVIFFRKKDKQLAIDANSDAKELNSAAAKLNKKGAVIITINKETKIIHDRLMHQVELAQPLFEKDYKAMSKEEKHTLGNIVRNTFSLAEMLNKKAEHI